MCTYYANRSITSNSIRHFNILKTLSNIGVLKKLGLTNYFDMQIGSLQIALPCEKQ